jgi:hypothetical protein
MHEPGLAWQSGLNMQPKLGACMQNLTSSLGRVISYCAKRETQDQLKAVLMMATAVLLHEQSSRPLHRGSVKGRKANVKHNHEKSHYQLYRDNFHHTKPTYDAQTFRCRYRMSRKLFMTILNGVRAYDDYFTA